MKKNLFGTMALSLLLAGGAALSLNSCKNDEEEEEGKKECTSKFDCDPGFICNDKGKCEAMSGCDPTDENACKAGEICTDLGECVACGKLAKKCEIIGMTGQVGSALTVAVGSKTNLEAVALDESGAPIYCATFEFSGGSVSGSEYTAAAGDSKITAKVSGSDVQCELSVKVLDASAAESVQVFVYDDATGQGVAGAKVVVDADSDYIETDASGIAAVTVKAAAATTFTVTAFKADYNYTTIADVPVATKSVAVPVGHRPLKSELAGGSKGKFSFDEFAKSFLGGTHQDFKAAFVTNTIPLSSVFTFDLDNFLGSMTSGCSIGKDGCYSLADIIPDSIMSLIPKDANGNSMVPEAIPLPGGAVVGAKKSDMKATYTAPAIPGQRIPWALGLEIALNDVIGIVPMFTSKTIDVPTIFDAVLPLFSKFGTAVGVPAAMPAGGALASQDLSLSEKFRIYRELKVDSLPADAESKAQMDAIGILRLVNARGYGAMLTGLTLSADIDGNGKIDAATVCKNEKDKKECPKDVSGKVPEGSVGILYAPAQKSIKNADDKTIVVAAPIGKQLMNAEKLPSANEYGAIRLTANVIKGAPKTGDSIKASDFIGLPTIDASAPRTVKDYAFENAQGADMNLLLYSAFNDDNDFSSRWVVYSKSGSINLPKVPDGMGDPRVQNSSKYDDPEVVVHLSLKLDGVTYENLVANNGNNVERALEQMSKFSIMVPYYPSIGNNDNDNN